MLTSILTLIIDSIAAVLGGVLLLHVADPVAGGRLLAMLAVPAAAALWFKVYRSGWSRAGLAVAALLPVVLVSSLAPPTTVPPPAEGWA